MTALTRQLIREFRVPEAFWTTAETVAYDSEAQMLFLLLLRQNNNVPLLFDDVKKIEMMAWQGNPYMMYAYARLHDVLQYDNDSDSIKHDFYKLAASHGIGDAYAQLAYMHKDGDLGECDYDAYNDLMQKALDNHSEKAMQQHIRDIIYGTNGSPRDALKGYELAENHVHQQDFHDPEYYMLMGNADRELGRIGNAVTNYELATEHGGSAGFFWWAVTDCCDRDGIVVDRDGFAEIMQKGRAVDARDCYLMYTMLTDDATYEALDPDAQRELSACLSDDLQAGWCLGDSVCPYYLGFYYEKGLYGFAQDYQQAWLWYGRAARLRSPHGYAALTCMILDDSTAPADCDESFAYEYAYKGLMLGCDDLLQTVIRGYRQGFLDHHKAKIEEIWLPQYDEWLRHVADDDDYPCDSEA